MKVFVLRILAVLTIAIFLLPQFAWGDDGYRLMVESYYDNKLKDIIQSQEIKDLLIAANKQQAEWGLDDFETLKAACKTVGLHCEKIMDGEHFDYLAKLTL